MLVFNINSNQHISALLFGGKFTVVGKESAGFFKGGKQKGLAKFRNIKLNVTIKGLGLKPLADWKTTKEGQYQTGEEILASIAGGKISGLNEWEYPQLLQDAKEICAGILKIRGLQKELSTYYKNTKQVIYDFDSCVRCHYIHVKTATARLAHTNPNLGNQPKPPSKVLEHFNSRYKDGKIVIADYKSIDVRCEAELCHDKQYRSDIINNLDMHTKNLALAESVSYQLAEEKVLSGEWKDNRSHIKGFTFSQQYLASPETSAKASGLSVDEVIRILDARKKEYPKLYQWHDNNNKEVNKKGYYTHMLGRMFCFTKYPPKHSWQSARYSPNEISNYKTQGLAGDVVGVMLGKFWREKALYNRDKYLLINTVHDSVMFDCKSEYVEILKKDIQLLDKWQEVCYNKFNYDWVVPISTEVSIGSSWAECF